MLFTFLMTTAVCHSVALRPEVTGYQSSSISKLGAEVARAERFEGAEGLSALQSAASIVNSIMLQAGNITEHMTDDDKILLESIEPMIEQSIYGSMDSSHEADVASIQAALDAINQCNTDIAARLGVLGDLNKLQFEVVDFQDALNDLQDDVDAKTQANSTKFDELQKHIDNIGAAPDCEAFPSNPTKLKVDNFFTGSLHVNWYTAQQEAYAPFADAVEVADGELGAALTAYAVGLAERKVAYCDWKVELEGGCEVFNQCYQSKKAKYLSELKPALQGDMQIRIDGYKAGQTIIAQIAFLLGESTESAPPTDIDTGRFQLQFPDVSAKGECSLSPLDADEWVPKPLCSAHTVPRFVKYPESSSKLNVVGHMAIATDGQSQTLRWSMSGLDTACVEGWLDIARPANSCGVHIHTGTSCDTAAGVGGHFWDKIFVPADPWKTTVYSAGGGSSVQTSDSEIVTTGLTSDDILDRVMVVHDSTGARIACGVIE